MGKESDYGNIIILHKNMKTIRLLIAAIALMAFPQALRAQEDYDIYLQKARQRLAEGDCSAAQRNYDVYKELTHKTDASVERRIMDCQGLPKTIEPFTVNYLFKRDSYSLDRNANLQDRRLLVEKIDSGAAIMGFRIDVWIGPDVGEGHASALADRYAAVVEQDLRGLLASCNKSPDAYLFETRVHAVDRNTFLFFVENTNLKDKYAIMSALNNSDEFENTLEWLLSAYPDFEKEVMPLLRKVQVYVY